MVLFADIRGGSMSDYIDIGGIDVIWHEEDCTLELHAEEIYGVLSLSEARSLYLFIERHLEELDEL